MAVAFGSHFLAKLDTVWSPARFLSADTSSRDADLPKCVLFADILFKDKTPQSFSSFRRMDCFPPFERSNTLGRPVATPQYSLQQSSATNSEDARFV